VIVFVSLVLALLVPSAVQEDAQGILAKAIEASGGADALKRARVLNWRGRATIYAGERQIRVEGRWVVEPPDRATVTTWEVEKGESSARRLIVDGSTGSMERDGKSMPMPAEILANERDQFYLYSVLKLVPLLDEGVKLTAVRDDGSPGITVVRSGRPDVTIYFDASWRPTRLQTTVLDPTTKERVAEELQFDGTIDGAGMRWPRRIRILQKGKLFVEMEILELSITE
jgi:hypothetical protein